MKVCILAAGVGQQLNSFSETLGEALLPISNTTALSIILNKFPSDSEFIIAIGHKADLVKSYCEAVHDDLNITFVDVENYESSGSGPGYSLLQCRPYLDDKFYLTTVDCLYDEDLPEIIDTDWIGVAHTLHPNKYATLKTDNNNKVVEFINRSRLGYPLAFIGLAFIYSYELFWNQLEKYRNKENLIEFVSAWYEPNLFNNLLAIHLTWNDTDSIENYNHTLSKYGSPNLGMDKIITEHTFLQNNTIVKISLDKNKNLKRIKRAEQLKNLIPKIKYKSDNVIAYSWVDGEEMYFHEHNLLINRLLNYLKDNLWKKVVVYDFNKICYSFYHDKTFQRYGKINYINDEYCVINGLKCKPVINLLSKINFDMLSYGSPVRIHGDLQFQNIIVNKDDFTLIDWREDFAGLTECGDLFYDLAKLYACLQLDYSKIREISKSIEFKNDNNFTFKNIDNNNLKESSRIFERFILENQIDIDLDKIKILSALIWLNMSPLHKYPDNLLLFLYSKYYLNSIFYSNRYFQID